MAMKCNPCDCPEQYYRDTGSWRKAVLKLLCNIISNTSSSGDSPTILNSGGVVVSSAGTPVKLLNASTPCDRIDIQAKPTNTDIVVIGGSDVDATPATQKGISMAAGDVYSMAIADVSLVYVDSIVNNEGVNFIYYN